jgi:hypothetical protein
MENACQARAVCRNDSVYQNRKYVSSGAIDGIRRAGKLASHSRQRLAEIGFGEPPEATVNRFSLQRTQVADSQHSPDSQQAPDSQHSPDSQQAPDSQHSPDSQQAPLHRQGPPEPQLQPSASQGQSSQTQTSQQLQGLVDALIGLPKEANTVGIASERTEHKTANLLMGILRLEYTKPNHTKLLCLNRLIPPAAQ